MILTKMLAKCITVDSIGTFSEDCYIKYSTKCHFPKNKTRDKEYTIVMIELGINGKELTAFVMEDERTISLNMFSSDPDIETAKYFKIYEKREYKDFTYEEFRKDVEPCGLDIDFDGDVIIVDYRFDLVDFSGVGYKVYGYKRGPNLKLSEVIITDNSFASARENILNICLEELNKSEAIKDE